MTTVDFDGDFQTIAGQTGDIIGNPVERNRAVSAVSRYCLRPKCFVTEGWSLYWDLLLWDMQYQKTPAERIGVVFWHMHHRARLIFLTADECISFLVDRVGFERANAIGERRRSFTTNYGVLYPAGYLLGGMQTCALRKELVDSGKMTTRQFHDAILKENYIPMEMTRADLEHLPLTADYKTNWKFRGEVAVYWTLAM